MTKIKIFLNGEPREIPEKTSVKQLFTFLELSDKHCAVEINKEIIFKSIWSERELLKEDRVEIVRAIGGG